jgi:magnesium transporter
MLTLGGFGGRSIRASVSDMAKANWFHFSAEGTATEALSLENVLSLKRSGGFIWCAYVSPGKDDLQPLVDSLGIHPLSIDDCFDDDHLPKIDLFPEYTGILFNDFLNGSDTVNIGEVNFFLGKDFIVSVFQEESADIHQCGAIFAELAFDTVKPVSGPARVLHAMLDRIVNNKFAAVESVGDRISEFEDIILTGEGQIDNAALHGIRQNLRVMRKSLFHEREILARICRRDSPLIRDVDLAYFSNLYDHIAKFVELVESNRETVTDLVQIQLSLTSNAMAESANRTNHSVNRLTLITTIFMPLSLIAGIGGMSEWTTFTGPENWKIAYPLLLGFMALIGVVNYIVLKRLDKKR